MTRAVKDALTAAYADLGGDAKLVEWARENLTEFYRIWAKMLPKQIEGADDGPVRWDVVICPHGNPPAGPGLPGADWGSAETPPA